MQEFLRYAESKGLHISQSQKSDFEKYLTMLLEWNQKFNLTAIKEPEEIWVKHFLDSLTVFDAIPKDAKKIMDIGSGAGFPGLPIAIIRPDLDVTLLEATGKKVNFLLEVIRELSLKNVRAIQKRAEEAGFEKIHKEKYDVVLARAVAMLPKLAECALPLLKVGGILIAQKKSGTDEVAMSEEQIIKLGGKIKQIIQINIDALPNRELVVIKKP